MKVEDPFIGPIPAEKIESIENVMVEPEFPQFKTLWLVEVCLLIENKVWHLNLPIVDNLFHGNMHFGKVHLVILTIYKASWRWENPKFRGNLFCSR